VLTFLSAAEMLLARYPGLRFRIVGPDAGDEERARRQVRVAGLGHAVEFVGPVSREQALQEYAGAAAYVLPTENENFSISVLEALMVGTPTVVTASTRNLDVLRSADAVQVSSPDAEGLAAAIAKLLDDPALCAERSVRGRDLVLKHFTIENVVDHLEEHYRA
jgi:glycosyltransferase involved in cell wall biosynthesis